MHKTNKSDVILAIRMVDEEGATLRVKDCDRFKLRVWTQNKDNHLTYMAIDINQEDDVDKIAIPARDLAVLESGILQMEYFCGLISAEFDGTDGVYDFSHTIVTDYYWKNIHINERPSNPIDFSLVEELKLKMEGVAKYANNKVETLQNYIEVDFANKLNDEISRSTQVDVEMSQLINDNKAECESDYNELNDKITSEISRSTSKDNELSQLINSNKAECESDYNELNDKITSEINRSTQADAEMNQTIQDNLAQTSGQLQSLADDLEAEIIRSTTKDSELSQLINANKAECEGDYQELDAKITAEISRSTAKDNELDTNLTSEIARAKQEENRIEAKVDNEITRAKTAESSLSDTIDSEKARAKSVEETLSDSITNEKARAIDREQHIDDDLHTEITRAKAEEARIEALVIANSESDSNVVNQLAAEVTRATNAEAVIANNVTTVTDNLTSEIARAKEVEGDITSSLQTLKQTVLTNKNDLTDVVNDLATEVTRATAAEAVNAAAIADNADDIDALEGNVNTLTVDLASEVTRATNAEAVIDNKTVTNAANITSEINRAKAVETEITSALQTFKTTVTNNYATKTEVDARIEGVIGTAPEALDTLGEIADKLESDSDAIAVIKDVLTGKANKADVYTKNEVDTFITEVSNNLSTEVTRATNAETTNANAIAVINGDVDTIGSIKHCLDDAKHYTDDEITKLKADQNLQLSNMATKNELTAVDTKVDTHITAANTEIADIKADIVEINNQLGDGASSDELGELANIVSTKANKADVYTKTECDEKFLTEHQSLADYALKSELYDDTALAERVATLEAIDHSQYLTEHQSLADYATKEEVNAAVEEATEDISLSLSEGYAAATDENPAPAAGDTLEVAIGKLHKAVLDDKYATAEAYTAIRENAGFETDGTYNPTATELSGKNVTEAIDYLAEQVKNATEGTVDLSNYYNKTEVDTKIGEIETYDDTALAGRVSALEAIDHSQFLTAHQSLDNYYNKTEVDTKIGEIETYDDTALAARVTTLEAIDHSQYLTEHQSLAAYATKEEVDNALADKATIWTGTQAEYDAITTKNNNTLYIVTA